MKFFKVVLSVLISVVCSSDFLSASTIDSIIWENQKNSETELIYVLDSVELCQSLIDLTNSDILEINNRLKLYGYEKYSFSNINMKFLKIKKEFPLNTYFLQKQHLKKIN